MPINPSATPVVPTQLDSQPVPPLPASRLGLEGNLQKLLDGVTKLDQTDATIDAALETLDTRVTELEAGVASITSGRFQVSGITPNDYAMIGPETFYYHELHLYIPAGKKLYLRRYRFSLAEQPAMSTVVCWAPTDFVLNFPARSAIPGEDSAMPGAPHVNAVIAVGGGTRGHLKIGAKLLNGYGAMLSRDAFWMELEIAD